jgi:hypothetical protein
MKRTWRTRELFGALEWLASDALVRVISSSRDSWTVDVFEYGHFVGTETAYTRSGAVKVAKRWVRALTTPKVI